MTGRHFLHQRGAALLAAMLTVTLVATFAATAMWQQWRAIEVETAERGRVQSAWILIGALDWSRLILAEDASGGSADHLAEPWAVPLEEARLSTFLAADRNVSQVEDASTDTRDAFLSGHITDLQSRLNLMALVVDGKENEEAVAQFRRLFSHLGLAPGELATLTKALRQAQDKDDANAPLLPQTLEQLTWLGVAPATVAALAPHVALLPERNTRLNLNTADAPALMAGIEGLDPAGANKLIAVRQLQHFRTLSDTRALLGSNVLIKDQLHGVSSNYFEVRGRLRLDDVTVDERSLVQRMGRTVKTIWRQRGAAVLKPTMAREILS
jgi:general secretion pathway protein K